MQKPLSRTCLRQQALIDAPEMIMRRKGKMICKVGAEYPRRFFNGLRRSRDCRGLDFSRRALRNAA
jgi:hypothetical protein